MTQAEQDWNDRVWHLNRMMVEAYGEDFPPDLMVVEYDDIVLRLARTLDERVTLLARLEQMTTTIREQSDALRSLSQEHVETVNRFEATCAALRTEILAGQEHVKLMAEEFEKEQLARKAAEELAETRKDLLGLAKEEIQKVRATVEELQKEKAKVTTAAVFSLDGGEPKKKGRGK